MAKVGAVRGGCWYCGDDEGILDFSCEFDTYLHMECLQDRLSHCMDLELDLELKIIARELGLVQYL